MKRKKLWLSVVIAAMLVCAVAGIAGCSKKDVEGLYKPANLTYDGARLTWDKVTLAEHYTVQINGGEEKRVNTNLFTYDAKGEEFDATVNAVIGKKTYGISMHFIPLDPIANLTVANDGVLTWDEVAGATGYRISVNGSVLTTDSVENRYAPEAGNNRIKVRPVVSGDNSYYSSWSEEKQVNVNAAPSSVRYDGDELTWTGNAFKYEVTINGESQTVSGTRMRYSSGNYDFTVQVKALGDHITTFDSAVAEEDFHYLQPVTGLVVESGILRWNAVESAEGYRIKINDVVQQKTVTEPLYDGLKDGMQLVVSVQPYNNSGNYFSSWTDDMNIYILPAPSAKWNPELQPDGEDLNNFTWDIVNGAAGYAVEVQKDSGTPSVRNFPADITAFPFAYGEVGEYKVRVKAVAQDGSNYYDSKYTNEITVNRLAGPKQSGNDFVESDPASIEKGFTVNYTAVAGATNYQLYKDGVLMEGKTSTVTSISDRDVVDPQKTTEQTYNYMVRSMGGSPRTVAGKTVVTLPCLEKDALSFEIKVQAMPTEFMMNGFNATWSPVSGANGYSVQYDGQYKTANGSDCDLQMLEAGRHDISVCTRGNGGRTLASQYTATIAVQRLEAPRNIRITYGTGNGTLEFNSVTNAKSYQTYIGTEQEALPENAANNMYNYITEQGTTLHMIAVCNDYNEEKTVYYMTSKASETRQFIRLAAPVFPEGAIANSVELVWNASKNINTAEYTPTYEVYEKGVMQTGGQQNGTKFNIEYLGGGNQYSFTVKAVGNNVKYLDSAPSEPIVFEKLATPTIGKKNNRYCWQSVAGATGYTMEINGKKVTNEPHVSGSEYTLAPLFEQVGTHTVTLVAVGDGRTTVNSKAATLSQVVRQCTKPEFTYAYSANQVETGGKIVVTVSKTSANTSGYIYEIGGETLAVTAETTAEKVMNSAGSYQIRVRAAGAVFDNQGTYWIASQWSSTSSIELLAPPSASTFKISDDGRISWTGGNQQGYEYEIACNGGSYGETQQTSASLITVPGGLTNSQIKIRVRARGDGTSKITSEWVEWIWNK